MFAPLLECTKHTMLGPLLEVEMSKKCTPLLARSTFPSQNVQNTPLSDHFWKLRCRKSARRCGAKHISKSKCTKHTIVGPLLEVEMSKKCTPLWCEAHFEVKMYKAHHCRTTFGSSDVASRGRRKGLCTLSKVRKREGFVAFSTTTTTTPHYTPIHYTTLQLQLQLRLQLHNYTPLRSTTLHYTILHYTTLHYTTLHSTTLHYTTRHYLPLHYPTLHSTTLHYTTRHHLPLHFTTLHYTTLHNTTTTTTLHNYTPLQLQLQLHSTTLHYTALNYTTLPVVPHKAMAEV